MRDIRTLQNRLQEHLKQANEASPTRHRSGSQHKSGGDRSISKSRSRSPSQPSKALIPKKKSFTHVLAQQKNMNFTTNEVGQQLSESLLNMSSGEHVQPSRAHATSKLAKRKLESLLQNQAQLENSTNLLAYTSFEEASSGEAGKAKRAGQQLAGNAHHSLSMFDSEVGVNQVSQFAPLHHQLSQNVIVPQQQPLTHNSVLGRLPQRDQQRPTAVSSKQLSKHVKLPKRSSQNPEKRLVANHLVREGAFRTNPAPVGRTKGSRIN